MTINSTPALRALADPNQPIPAYMWRAQTFDEYEAEQSYQTAQNATLHRDRFKWLKKAADLGHRQAMVELGNWILRFRPQERPAAIALWERAAKLGHVMAAIQVSLAHLETNPHSLSYHRACVHTFIRAEQQAKGKVRHFAQYWLGTYYLGRVLSGKAQLGAPQDTQLGLHYLHLAADGNIPAMIALHRVYAEGLCGVEKDPERAAEYIRRGWEIDAQERNPS